MIRNTVLVTRTYYYPLGNTPAVCLTADLPPEQDADILLLGCGDVRNILFTCFMDAGRKIDVTCNDIEPGIHARNVLLYTLLIDDPRNLNIECSWNIYYHWKLDKKSAELLETQVQKLLEVSKSIDQWHNSVYGLNIRFCDERTLSLVRSYWAGFRLQGLSDDEKTHRRNQMQTALDRLKAHREKVVQKRGVISDLRSVCPFLSSEVIEDLPKVIEQWWDCGLTPSSGSAVKEYSELNPTFLHLRNKALTLHEGLSPLAGFPLSIAYVPIAEQSQFHLHNNCESSTKRLGSSARKHFRLWASAFRSSLENKSVIRISCGDALAFGCTLRYCQLASPKCATSMNLFCDNFTNSPLKLHQEDYGDKNSKAPLKFDIIDTSNLVDHLGLLNMVAVFSSLLKYTSSSSLYTEMLCLRDPTFIDRLFSSFGVDASAMCLLFGLVLPDLFTNAQDSFEYDLMMNKTQEAGISVKPPITQVRSRLRFKRPQGFQKSVSPFVRVEPKELAKLLIQVHGVMFEHEDLASMMESTKLGDLRAFHKQNFLSYNRLSFAFLINILKATVVTDWDQCISSVYSSCFHSDSLLSIRPKCKQDLLLQMHLCGVHNSPFSKPTPADLDNHVLAPILPFSVNEDIPIQVCVTIRIPREKLKVFTKREGEEIGKPALICYFEGISKDGDMCSEIFSAVQVTFGKWCGQASGDRSYPFIEEDSSELYGTSDMFLSVYVPTFLLLQSKRCVPRVKCGLVPSSPNILAFLKQLGTDLQFSCNKMTDKDVFVTRFMPGMPGLPIFAVNIARQNTTSATTTVRLTDNDVKINTLVQHIPVESPTAKTTLADRSSEVTIKFTSPLTAIVSIAKSVELKVDFPIPVSPTKYKVRIARKSSYIEVESPLFDPLTEDSTSFILPTFITKVPGGATIPIPLTSTRINLDVMPPIDLKNAGTMPWLKPYVFEMFSEREARLRKSVEESDEGDGYLGANVDKRLSLKNNLYEMLTNFARQIEDPPQFFMLSNSGGYDWILMFPSCLRLDLVNRTVALDIAVFPFTSEIYRDSKIVDILENIYKHRRMRTSISENEFDAWKAILPASVERCRSTGTWKHTSNCEYIQAGEAPIPSGPSEFDHPSPLCTCGVGKFPKGYLESRFKTFPELQYILEKYATRAAMEPIFPVPYVENLFHLFYVFASRDLPRR